MTNRGGRIPKDGQHKSPPSPEAIAVAAAETAAVDAALPSLRVAVSRDEVSGVRRPVVSLLMPLWPTVMSGGAQLTFDRGGNDQVMVLIGVEGDFVVFPGDFCTVKVFPA